MAVCPQCDRTISDTVLNCPHCNTQLKAHGHPGMTLHRAKGKTYLCDTCAYEADNSCNFPKRPTATTCTLYQDIGSAAVEPTPQQIYSVPWWRKINQVWLLAAAVLFICILVNIG